MQGPSSRGYTLVETIVALLLFSVGGLALASSAALIGRRLNVDGARERAALIAASRLEVLRASCATATGGAESLEGVELAWSVAPAGVAAIAVAATVRYPTWTGRRSDSYHSLVPCP